MKNAIKSKPIYKQKGGEKRMKHLRTIVTLGAGAIVLATMAFLNSSSTWAIEDVRHTKHNLSANPNIGSNQPEVCVYCHTPHGGNTAVGSTDPDVKNAAPLWNRASSTATYNMYTSPNFDGTGIESGPIGVSVACLSCHDGTVAFDSLINDTGSGNYDASGPRRNHTFSGTTYVNADGTFNEGSYPPDPMPNLGPDLRNDHPISIKMCADTSTNGADPQFNDACTTSAESSNGNLLKVKRSLTDAKDTVDIRDHIRLYPTKGVGNGWWIECASCHNPHEASRADESVSYDPTVTAQNAAGITYSDTINSRFLRFPSFDPTAQPAVVKDALLKGNRNAGSLLCLSCHQK